MGRTRMGRTDGRTDGLTDGRTDGQGDDYMLPRNFSGSIKMVHYFFFPVFITQIYVGKYMYMLEIRY